ncbi:MAG: A24 family peptidase [Caulobacter sp.]|nr:A24 family peptidase [Caulobacter sp.]
MTAGVVLPVFAGLIGACAGSFAATAALRSLRGEKALAGRSRCDGCGQALGFAATTPIISFAVLRGACARCGSRIDSAHVAGEAAGATLAGAAFWLVPPAEAALTAALGLVLVAASIIDQRTQRLPNLLTLAVALLCLGLAALNGQVLVGIAAATITFVLLEGLRRGFLRLRGHAGLGSGDVKLLCALALWLGVATPWAIALAALVGLLVAMVTKPTDGRIAFGPLIAGGALMVGLAVDGGVLPAEWALA